MYKNIYRVVITIAYTYAFLPACDKKRYQIHVSYCSNVCIKKHNMGHIDKKIF